MNEKRPIFLDETSRRDPNQWPELSDTDWVTLHVPRFAGVRPHYEACAKAVRGVLETAAKKLAHEAIIQVRAKEVASFAEKILRKKPGYVDPKIALPPDPLMRMTDLCGGRVICQTEAQVRDVRKYLEEHFEIDWENSDDAGDRLRPTEFGYRTVNLIVSFKAGVFPVEVVPGDLCVPVAVPGLEETMPLKMEIQVRTLLAHAWADLCHDLAYKTEVTLPSRIKRDLASKAAVLEETDRDITRLVGELDAYRSNYGAHLKREEVEKEIAIQRIVMEQIDKPLRRADLAVKIAKLCLAVGDHSSAIAVLEPFAELEQHHNVQRTLGQALTEKHQDIPSSAECKRGRAHLENAAKAEGADAETYCLLGEAELLRGEDAAASAAYHEAIARDAAEPGSLSRYLEHEVSRQGNARLVALAEPMIRAAMERCRTQIEGCVNLPGAWAALSLLHLLVKEPHAAIEALARLVCLCEARPEDDGSDPRPCAAARHVVRLRRAVKRLVSVREFFGEGYDVLSRALLLALAVRGRDREALAELGTLASWASRQGTSHLVGDDSILILAGGCAPEVEPLVDDLGPHLLGAFVGLPLEGRSLVILSGGTKAGISRLAGDVAEASGGRVRACGYHPRSVPRPYVVDTEKRRYAFLCESPGKAFTALDPLQGWTDLAVAGVEAKRIKLLAFAPGAIARAEIAFAVALGARVGLIDHPAMPPHRRFDDSAWSGALEEGSLVRLPLDAMTFRAFLLTDELPEADVRFEAAARLIHEDYLKSAKPADPSLSPWEKLSEDLKVSNYHQASYWTNILATEGIGVRETPEGTACGDFDIAAAIGEAGVGRLAEMEHGRWNVERLLRGWSWAEKKDVLKKQSPYLVPWASLAPNIQAFDVEAIVDLTKNLRAAGFEMFLTDHEMEVG